MVLINSPERKLPSANKKWSWTNSLRKITSDRTTTKHRKNVYFRSSPKLPFDCFQACLVHCLHGPHLLPPLGQEFTATQIKTSTQLTNLTMSMKSPEMFLSRYCFSPLFFYQIRLGFNKWVLFLTSNS